MPSKDLSRTNITSIELTFPKSKAGQVPIKLDASQIDLFAEILENREETFVEPENCYNLSIKLKNGGGVNYWTDGLKFQGYDDSSDLPFSFETKQNVLKVVFKIKDLELCR